MEPPPNPPTTVEEILTGLSLRYRAIENCGMDIVAVEEVVNGIPPSPLKADKVDLGDKKLGFPWMRIKMLLHGQKRYQRIEVPQFGVWDAPLTGYRGRRKVQELSWNGKVGMRYEVSSATGAIVSNIENPVLENLVLRYLDWPVSEVPLSEQDHTYLPASLATKAPALAPAVQQRSGRACHVVEVPGLDKLWIDTERGFALVRREIHYSTGGPLRQVTDASDWQQVGTGTWFPKRIVREYYCPPDRPADKVNTVATRVTLSVSYTTNEIDDDAFTLKFKPGTMVADAVNNAIVRTPKSGLNPLDESVETAIRLEPQDESPSKATLVLVLFGLLGCLGLGAFLLFRVLGKP